LSDCELRAELDAEHGRGAPAGPQFGGRWSQWRVDCLVVQYRPATERDIAAIAALHADSWRRNYRGAYSDEFLDGDVLEDRRAVWSERLTQPEPVHDTVVAEHGGVIVGFVHTVLDHDPVWGALLDNLHVAHEVSRRGVGTQLMARSASAVVARGRRKSLYLLVLETNAPAQAFYEARGGQCVGSEVSEPPGGGSIIGLRYAWRDPSVLLQEP
jgi:ribosomal protein S18 acetylase RimI-like enzyme